NIKTPKKPKINPNTVGKLEKFSFHFGLSSTTNHIAVAAAIMLTIPLDIYCSDQITAAMSINSSKNPTKSASLTAVFAKSLYPLTYQYSIRIEPAKMTRIEPKANGPKLWNDF